MGRRRRKDDDLPRRVYRKNGTFYYVPLQNHTNNHRKRWIRLCTERAEVEETLEKIMRRPANALLHQLVLSSRKRAKKKGIEHTLTDEDLFNMFDQNGGRCAVSKVLFDTAPARSGNFRNPFRPSLDRVDAQGGYTRENCRLVCVAVNIAINEFGEAVFRKIAKGAAGRRR